MIFKSEVIKSSFNKFNTVRQIPKIFIFILLYLFIC